MKRLTSAIAALLLALAVMGSSGALAGPAVTAGPSHGVERLHGAGHAHGFERFLHRYEAANSAFVNGDPAPWLSITTEKDRASIFGGFGGRGDAGVANVRQRYLLAANAFRRAAPRSTSGTWSRTCVAGWLIPWRSSAPTSMYAGQTERRQQVLRATMIFRFEQGAWTVVHRHADTMVDLQLPTR